MGIAFSLQHSVHPSRLRRPCAQLSRTRDASRVSCAQSVAHFVGGTYVRVKRLEKCGGVPSDGEKGSSPACATRLHRTHMPCTRGKTRAHGATLPRNAAACQVTEKKYLRRRFRRV